MRRITKVAATAAIALTGIISTGSTASAAVSYDDYRVGHVDKGDVQALFGWNDAEFQQNAARDQVHERVGQGRRTPRVWTCSDGSTQHHSHHVVRARARRHRSEEQARKGSRLDPERPGSKTDFGTTTGVGSDGERALRCTPARQAPTSPGSA